MLARSTLDEIRFVFICNFGIEKIGRRLINWGLTLLSTECLNYKIIVQLKGYQ